MPRKVRSPTATYHAEARPRAKLFPNGRSQAVRLPMEFRLPGTEVYIRREGDRVILEPISERLDAKGWPVGFWDDLRRDAKAVEAPEIEPLGGALLTPEQVDPRVVGKRR